MSANYGLLIDYEFCTGCHSCEVACKEELALPNGQYGIKLLQDGPRELTDGRWEYKYLPLPTSLCNLCEGRLKQGKPPTCVHHCQPGVMYFGTIDELSAKAKEKGMVSLFVPKLQPQI
jgi:Fe-S-cluster-containing dehydrogenase component